MNLTKEEAAAALAAIDRSREVTRRAFRAHHGHYYLWLWGLIWIAMALIAQFTGPAGMQRHSFWLCGVGGLVSFLIGWRQSGEVRAPVDRRFLGVLIVVIFFSLLWLAILRPVPTTERLFVFLSLICAQVYIIAGIWFDSYLAWLGFILAVLLMVGFFFFLPIFWIWIAVCGGGSLILGGFYVRYFWR